MRALAIDMNRIAVANAAKRLGTQRPNAVAAAGERLDALRVPVAVMKHAAHLPNLDDPREFARIVDAFLARHVGKP